ncbi:hypothetical protein DV515_00005927 [Chloebia gouldiae]|uniref:Peptidase A2 domain-containing protein n=1 Tax=Chloebia gouldiae TaxID=44316 RepID=A0A3L8SL61_CHLGU|nr:hypothetical protein DV515_00005927 [Chloebia gouldiae]
MRKEGSGRCGRIGAMRSRSGGCVPSNYPKDILYHSETEAQTAPLQLSYSKNTSKLSFLRRAELSQGAAFIKVNKTESAARMDKTDTGLKARTLSTMEQGYKIQERKLIQLLMWVKTYCPWYPPDGSYDLDHWKRVGESLKSHQLDSHEVNPDEFITWQIVYSALQAFRDSAEILHPAVNLSADTSHALTAPLSRPDSVVLQVEEGINGEEPEGDLVNLRAIDLRQECDLYPAIKPQPLNAMAASPSTDSKVLKQQSCLPPYDASPLRHVTDNELSLSPEPKSFLDTCRRQALDQGDVELLHAMPTVYKGNRPHHEQISYEMVKELRKSVKENGLQSSYTMGLVEAIAKNYVMLPADWKALFKLIMTTRQYSIWWAEYEELCENQARANTDTGNAGITKDHLAGTRAQATIRDQLRMPPETYNQVRGLAVRALKRVPDITRTEPGFSTIRQGPQEPYITFIDRLQTAVNRQIDLPSAAEVLLKSLAYENANTDCRSCIAHLIPLPLLLDMQSIPSANADRGTGGFGTTSTPNICWSKLISVQQPFLTCVIDSKSFTGLTDTGADITIISKREWPPTWPLTTPAAISQALEVSTRRSTQLKNSCLKLSEEADSTANTLHDL